MSNVEERGSPAPMVRGRGEPNNGKAGRRKNSKRRPLIRRIMGASWTIGVIGGFLFLLAIALEATVLRSPSLGIEGSSFGHGFVAEVSSAVFWARALGELGAALVIAAVVSASVERVAKKEQLDHFEETLERMGQSVLEGVYEIRHEREYARAVVSTCLAVRYIRTNFSVHYEIEEFTDDECSKYGIRRDQYVKVVAELSYMAKNIGSVPDEFDGVYTCPTRPGLESVSEMRTLEVDGASYSKTEIAQAEVKKGSRHYNNGDRTYLYRIPVGAGGQVPVRITAAFVKERFDTEVFAFLFPTMGATIRFTFHSVHGLDIGAKARTATPMKTPPEPVGSALHWSIDGPILPNDYVSVWWQEKPAVS